MSRLENRATRNDEDTSIVVRLLPEDIREQLIHAKVTRSHSVSEMIAWLHDPNEGHPPEWQQITKTTLSGWFWRNSVVGPARKGGGMPKRQRKDV